MYGGITMKKLIVGLFSLFFLASLTTTNAVAGTVLLKPRSETIRTAMEYYFPSADKRIAALTVYHAKVKENNGGIYAEQLKAVCDAGELSRSMCNQFISALREQFENVCDKDDVSDNQCVQRFKSINTQMRSGVAIAQAWAKTQKNDTIVCNNKYRTSWNDDFLACYSVINDNVYYEFKFDDLNESNDVTTRHSIHMAACNLADLDFIHAGISTVASPTTGVSIQSGNTTWPDYCPTNKNANPTAKCEVVNKFAREFGFSAKYDDTIPGCTFEDIAIRAKGEIINEYKDIIDNFVYSSDKDQTQLQAAPTLDESIKLYAEKRLAPTPITSFKCDKAHKQWIRGVFHDNEDILTCYINDKRVDFVFDDLTQSTALWGTLLIEGSQQAMSCRAMGGIFDGEQCADLSKTMCEQVAALNLAECPDCKAATWDEENKICKLPASKSAKTTKTAIRVASNTGIATVTLVATVFTGGGALMITAASVAAIAAATSDGAKIAQDYQASDWVVKMNQIQTPEEAKKFLEDNLQEIMAADYLNASLRNGLDEMLTRVLEKTSDEYFYELVANCSNIQETADGIEYEYYTSLPNCPFNPDNGQNTWNTVIKIADTVQFIAATVMIIKSLTNSVKMLKGRAGNIATQIDELKNTGWVYRNNQWEHLASGQTAAKLPNGVPGWDPRVNRWRGALNNVGYTSVFRSQADVVRWLNTHNAINSLPRVGLGVTDAVISPSSQTESNVKIPKRESTPPATTLSVVGPAETVITTPKEKQEDKKQESMEREQGNKKQEYKGQEKTKQNATIKQKETTKQDVTEKKDVTEQTFGATGPTLTKTPQVRTAPTYTTSRDIKTHTVDKKDNTALIATAAIAGTIGAGWLIGGLIGKDNGKKTSATSVSPQSNSDLERLMQNAGGIIGTQNGVSLKLIPLPTTINSYAPIVDINGNAVVVVDYRGYKLPYYMNRTTMHWEPLLGIGANGGWFNVYPNQLQSEIPVIDSIADHLGHSLTPSVVLRHISNTASGPHFPIAAPAAYQTINAEFSNGVVNTNTGTMSQSDKRLYNNNYQLIKQKLQ